MLDQTKIKPGAWYSIVYGFDRQLFCVIQVSEDGLIILETPNWCLSDALQLTTEQFIEHHPKFLGQGKRRFIVGMLRKWTDCMGTLYTKPKL